MADTSVTMLCSSTKLDRDKGAVELEKYLSSICKQDEGQVEELLCRLIVLLENPQQTWETKHGAFLGSQCVVKHLNVESLTTTNNLKRLKELSLKYLTDAEVRVRLVAGETLGVLCHFVGVNIYIDCKDIVLELIKSNLEHQMIDNNAASQAEQAEIEKIKEKLAAGVEDRHLTAEEIFHDTAGWKSLETSMKALQFMIEGCGKNVIPLIDEDLLDLVFQTLSHTNRFVRETGYFVCAALIGCGQEEDGVESTENHPMLAYGHKISMFLGKGMSDNWSQVRLAACMASRKFLLSFRNEKTREMFYPELLPKICLNRYYLADGVRLYSQETWRQIAGTQGKHLVQKYIANVVQYYTDQTKADNHAVREAGCLCIAELAAKINKDALQPFVLQLLEALLACFRDDSWPVRDAACLASGNFILCFPEESRSAMDTLFPLFFQNLKDNIPSVRQGAAASLANAVKAYGDMALGIVLPQLHEGLQAVNDQPSESEKYGDLDKGPATFGVVKRLRDNDMDLHTDQTMYSCGSLAPKMSRGRLCGCLDRTFKRPLQPWEFTEGCVFALAELAQVPQTANHISQLLPLLAKAVEKRHFTHHVVLLETTCSQLPVIAKGIGKKFFKPYIELFIDPMFYGLNCENALTSSAASYCLNQLGAWIGPKILRGRVEQHAPKFLPQFDANIHIAPL